MRFSSALNNCVQKHQQSVYCIHPKRGNSIRRVVQLQCIALSAVFRVVQKLKEEDKVWCIHNASEKDDVLFPKDPKPLVSLTQDLVNVWHSTKVHLFHKVLAL